MGMQGIGLLINLSLPILLTALCVGLTMSLLQALSSVQEQTLSFAPKTTAVFSAILLMGPFMGMKLLGFITYIFTHIPEFILTN